MTSIARSAAVKKTDLMVHGQSIECAVPKKMKEIEAGAIKEAREKENRGPEG